MNIKDELSKGKNIYDLPLRVSYYARVSTDSIEQASSIVNQVDYFVKYINFSNKWIMVNGYVDEGISGKDVKKREHFLKMIDDAKKGCFDLILTKSVSRFARNTIDSIYYTNLLLDLGVGVFFINDNINTIYPDSEFRLTLMASIAQDELRKLSESVKFGLRQSINRGVVMGSNNILGYIKNKGSLVIKEDEAMIVREIFKLFISGDYSYSEVARRINNKYGIKLNSTSVKRILTNCKYKGYYCGRKSEVIDYKKGKRKSIERNEWIMYKDSERVPAIIEEVVFDKVNEIIRKRDLKKNTYRDKYYGKVKCVLHGRTLRKVKRYNDRNYCYYVCPRCGRVSSKLLNKIVKGRLIKEIVLSWKECLRVDISFDDNKLTECKEK